MEASQDRRVRDYLETEAGFLLNVLQTLKKQLDMKLVMDLNEVPKYELTEDDKREVIERLDSRGRGNRHALKPLPCD